MQIDDRHVARLDEAAIFGLGAAPLEGHPGRNGQRMQFRIETDLRNVNLDVHPEEWLSRDEGRPELAIQVDRPKAALLGLTVTDVIEAASEAHSTASAGYLANVQGLELPLRQTGRVRSVEDIKGTVITYHDGAAVAEWLRGLGPTVLVNESVVIERDGDLLVVGGTDDCDEGTVDPQAGCAGRPPVAVRQAQPQLMLMPPGSHEPL